MVLDIINAFSLGIIIFYLSLPDSVHALCFFLFWIAWGLIACLGYLMAEDAIDRRRA
jgi:hypothetical protein